MNAEKAILNLSNNKNLQVKFVQFLNSLHGTEIGYSGITTQKVMDDFLRRKINANMAFKTIEAYENSFFNHLSKFINLEDDISTLTQDVIERSIESLQQGLSKASLNKFLREIRTFYNDCKKRGIISHTLEIKELRLDQVPAYMSEIKIKKILSEMKPEHRGYIKLYLATCSRLNEIYNSRLESDNFLVISDPELTKTRKGIEIELSPENVIIYKNLMASGLSSNRLSRLFKMACVKAGYPEHHFHHLRHTGAIMEYIRSGNIFHVKMMLHHSTVKTTESFYLQHSERRLRRDFPSLYDAE